jgi:hypothetical protein
LKKNIRTSRFLFLYVGKKAEGQREVCEVAELQALCSGAHHIMRTLLPLVQLNQAACFSDRKRETCARKGAYDIKKEEQKQMQRLSSNFQSPLPSYVYNGRCRLSHETGHVIAAS